LAIRKTLAQIAFPRLGVYFVSREPVRAPPPLAAFAAVRAGLERSLPSTKLVGSLSATTQNRFAIAACPEGLGRAPESSLCEVYEYDPVRYQAMVIGLVEPPSDTPVHWIARRVNPQATVVAVVPDPPRLGPRVGRVPRPRGYLGDPNTLLTVGRALKGKRAAFVEGTGLVLIADSPLELAPAAKAALGRAPPAKRPTGSRVDSPPKRASKSRK
jgi:hypothetical protein